MRPGNQSGDQTRSFIEQARRAQIVQAAVETIAELGFARASLVRIAGRAKISPGLISYHFTGKDELIAQVAAEITGAMTQAVEDRAAGATTYTETLVATITGVVHYVAEHRTEMYALREIATNTSPAASPAAAPAGSPDGPASPDRTGAGPVDQERTVADLAALLRAGQRAGEFREFNPRLMAVTLTAALEAAPRELYSRPDTDVDTYAAELAETFVLAVRRSDRHRGRRDG